MAEVGFSIVYYVLLSIYQTLGKNDIWPDEQKKKVNSARGSSSS